jgi:DNA helicase IV
VPDVDPSLAAEQRYLATARADLAAMRARVEALQTMGGDAVSDAYLAATLFARIRALTDDPDTPLFFGRTDTDEGRWYIGRRHVQDPDGQPRVIDWRADVSLPFYRATHADAMGVALRRRYGFAGGTLTAYEDEHLTDQREQDRRSAIVAAEIQRPRVGPMRDIVATIQPEQDAVVRTDVTTTVCIQGAPGTGKTAVGLHRVAFLLYAFRERLLRSGVLVIGPNSAFLSYIGQVLPALGEYDVAQTTIDALTASVPIRAVDTAEVAGLKGDPRMAEVLRRAVWSHIRTPTEALVIPIGSYRWRVSVSRATAAIDALRARDVRYGAGRALLAQRLAHEVLVQMERQGETTDDRVQDRVARHRATKAYVDAVWPAVDPVRLVRALLSDRALLASHAEGLLTAQELDRLVWPTPPRGPASTKWSVSDTVLLDETTNLIERTPALGHVVLDEAQDLSPMQLRAVGRRCSTGSATVLGDLAQGTTVWATASWTQALQHLGKPDAQVEELTQGFRVPAAIIDFAAQLLPHLSVDLQPPTSIRDDPGLLSLIRTDAHAMAAATVAAVRLAKTRPGSVGVICADQDVQRVETWLNQAELPMQLLARDDADATSEAPIDDHLAITVVPASLAKGLEYDSVVVVEPAAIVAAEPRGLNRLYVVLTRAVTSLAVVHAQPLPPALLPASQP